MATKGGRIDFMFLGSPLTQRLDSLLRINRGKMNFSMTIKKVHEYPSLLLFCFESKVNHLVLIFLKCYLIFFWAFSLLHVHCNSILGCFLISIGWCLCCKKYSHQNSIFVQNHMTGLQIWVWSSGWIKNLMQQELHFYLKFATKFNTFNPISVN